MAEPEFIPYERRNEVTAQVIYVPRAEEIASGGSNKEGKKQAKLYAIEHVCGPGDEEFKARVGRELLRDHPGDQEVLNVIRLHAKFLLEH